MSDGGDLEHLSWLFFADLGMCGCGNPEGAWDLVRGILAAAPLHSRGADGVRGSEKARALCGSDGAFHAVLSLLTEKGLMEHGSSIGGGWLTPKGAHYLGLMSGREFDDICGTALPHAGEGCPADCPHALASD